MIDIKFLRENPEAVKENIRKKFQDHKLPLVDEVIELDAEARKTQQEADNLRAERNKLSKQIGALMGQGKKEEAEEVTLATEKQNVESEENILPEQATARQEETQIAEKEVPKELKNSYLKGSFGTDRVSMEITCSEQEAEVMKKLIDLTAKKRNRFGLFTSISNVDEYVLKVWCEWEDVPVISSIVTEVKKRTKKKD